MSEVHHNTDETSTLLGQLFSEEQSQKLLSSLFQEENIIVYKQWAVCWNTWQTALHNNHRSSFTASRKTVPRTRDQLSEIHIVCPGPGPVEEIIE